MKRITAATIVALLVIVAVVAALLNKSDNTTQNNQPANNAAQQTSNQASTSSKVNIVNMLFTPSQITVQKGQTVTWTNNDSTTHTVTIDNGTGPNSGDVAPGETYSYTFKDTGSYQYHCSIHPSMRGTIVVK